MDSFNHDDSDLLNSLGELRPLAPKLNRDRMLFEAGRASKPSPWTGRILPAITIALALVLIQRESQVAWERGQRQILEAKLAKWEQPSNTPTVTEPERAINVASTALAPSSYGALSQRLRSFDGDDPWNEAASPFQQTAPLRHPEDLQSPPLKALDSRTPFSL